LAKILHKEGAKIIAIIEKDGGIYTKSGIDPIELKLH
jgi:glutamate dehydrogenase/leucine dehydrogenase